MSPRARPEQLLDQELPDLALPSTEGGVYRLRGNIGRGPQVLFFYIRNGTPG
jgi:peroxiredoxin